jgi:hypothetical protein
MNHVLLCAELLACCMLLTGAGTGRQLGGSEPYCPAAGGAGGAHPALGNSRTPASSKAQDSAPWSS